MMIGVALVALIHCAIWFAHYNQTALGESPALDNRQTLELARAMSDGRLAEEPFHRAPLYPYLLSLFLNIGLPHEMLPLVARWLNAFALALTAGSAAFVALRLWGKPACGWMAGLLVALNPVFIFFAGDAFDILPATACLAASLALLQAWLTKPSFKGSLLIGVLLALGAALRSHLLPIAILWPVASFILSNKDRLKHAILPLAPLLISFLLLGLANLNVSGEFRMMPWQGAYNLWAGNGPDASGRIYAQKIRVDFENGYDNPAKLESIALYEQETEETPPHSIDTMNAYWKEKALNYIAEHPADWLGLMLRKAYYFLNSYEQYDNKTYGFHKQQNLLLLVNPIHWGLLLALAVGGALIGLSEKNNRPPVIVYIILFAGYAAGAILFYTSNRFRLPMIPVLGILGSGAFLLPAYWRTAKNFRKLVFAACIALTLLIAYSNFFNARDKNTWEEDYALLANASLRTERDQAALDWAEKALRMSPRRGDMLEVAAQANFNLWALQIPPLSISKSQAERLLAEARQAAESNSDFHSIAGIYQWKLGKTDGAVRLWKEQATDSALALLCLVWSGNESPPPIATLEAYRDDKHFTLLAAVINIVESEQDPGGVTPLLDGIFSATLP